MSPRSKLLLAVAIILDALVVVLVARSLLHHGGFSLASLITAVVLLFASGLLAILAVKLR